MVTTAQIVVVGGTTLSSRHNRPKDSEDVMLPEQQHIDVVEMRNKIADLKVQEADLLRESAEIERELAKKDEEIAQVRKQINGFSAALYLNGTLPPDGGVQVTGHQIGKVKKAPGRPKHKDIEAVGGNPAQESLTNLIEGFLREATQGLALKDIVVKINQSGYVSMSKNKRTMIDQALSRLKKKERIVRNPENLRYFLSDDVKEEVA